MPTYEIGPILLDLDDVPELVALRGVPQPARHHPEIDTFVHVTMALAEARRLSGDPAVHWAVLVHDLGKGLTAPDLLPSHHGHEEAGLPLVEAVCRRFAVPEPWRDLALLVCEHHTRCHRAVEMTPAGLRRTLKRLQAADQPARFEKFLLACEADARGRQGLADRDYPQPSILRRALSGLS
jgi:tRNA nucleotidyltransferase (CCA-adding enzyme)